MAKGIDVAVYQGNIDWKKVKKDGIEFAMIRCGYGREEGQKDRCFEQNYKNAKAAGMPIGVYHYSYAKTVEHAKAEAKHCLSLIKGKQFEYPIAFDIEDASQKNLGKKLISDIIRAFCETLENAGYYVVVYANLDWLKNRIDEDCKKRYDIWLAQWADKPTYTGQFGLWQYSSNGKVDGIDARVDMDIAYKDYVSIIKNNGFNGFDKNETETVKTEVKTEVETKKPETKLLKAGTVVQLKDTSLYANASTSKATDTISGKYYIYDGEEIRGRYRITNSKERVNKKPIGENVTGFVNKSDLM